MAERTIYITEYDAQRLRKLLSEAYHSSYRGSEYLKNLQAELERGQVVSPQEVPADVITMNSKVRLTDLESGETMVCTLVFPEDADVEQDKISVLAPIGTAMLGYRQGDSFEWKVPEGVRRFKVAEILYQPERSGDYHL